MLDANVIIASWRDHYPIEIFPGFWECLSQESRSGKLRIIDRVRRDEILSPDALLGWLDEHWNGRFSSTRERSVVDCFREMQRWVRENPQFSEAAEDEFARNADGWIAAFCKVNHVVLVTNEVFDANAKGRVPLPNLCKQFEIRYVNTIGMLRSLNVKFNLR